MTIRRQLLAHDSGSVDFRVGIGALDGVARPIRSVMGAARRALVVSGPDAPGADVRRVSEELMDLEIAPQGIELSADRRLCAIDRALEVLEALGGDGITGDDMIIGFGDAGICSLVSFCARVWCAGARAVLIPTTLDAMVTSATSMRALDIARRSEMILVRPEPALVVCDLSYVIRAPADRLRAGYVALLRSALFGSRLAWDRLGERIPAILEGDEAVLGEELICAQSARLAIERAANPSARHARSYGMTCARALRRCLGDGIPRHALLAEGMRFEARLAADATKLDVDDVFEQDDRLEDLGIGELRFALDEGEFMRALAETSAERSNRFLFALPENPGTIRLAPIERTMLARHVHAFLSSRLAASAAGATRGEADA